jgi:hypothetical protein
MFTTFHQTTIISIWKVLSLFREQELKTTQVYAKIMDIKKKEAMNKIPDINI